MPAPSPCLLAVAARLFALCLLLAIAGVGCRRPAIQPVATGPTFAKPLPPGTLGLRLVTDPDRRPDLLVSIGQLSDPKFREAGQRSLQWFALPSTRQHYPVGPITHEQAQASVQALLQIDGSDPAQALQAIERDFDIWESVGWDGSGEVLYTAYYSPTFQASRERREEFQWPLYQRPDDLLIESGTGRVLGRRVGSGGIEPYPTRAELERSGTLRGRELVYLPSALDAYLIGANGSAKLRMIDGSTMYVGYDGTNGRPYTSLGKVLETEGKLPEGGANIDAIRDYFRQHPEQLQSYLDRNPRFVFFQRYDGGNWPAGSLGFPVTPWRSLATDKSIFPRGTPVLASAELHYRMDCCGEPTIDEPLRQLMFDQDTGGAIRAAGRADLYLGVGDEAGGIAGQIKAPGRLYYLLLKRERVAAYAADAAGATVLKTP